MHLIRSACPCAALRLYVRAYVQRELRTYAAPILEPVAARLEPCLHFNLGDTFDVRRDDSNVLRAYPAAIVGLQTRRRVDLVMTGGIEAFAVFFEPTGFTELFRVPSGQLVDDEVDAGSLFGDAFDALRARIGEAHTFEERVRIVEDFLLRQLPPIPRRNKFALAADEVFAARGVVRIRDIASQSGLSQRQFERGFRAETGCSPKLYARIARFQTALDMKIASPRRSWLDIAHSLYYHDQMHMVHDFQSLSGKAPERLMAELGESRPRAVVVA